MTEIAADVRRGKFATNVRVRAKWGELVWMLKGPDLRYSFGRATIPVDKIDDFRSGLADAFNEWQTLCTSVPKGVEVKKSFLAGGFAFSLTAGGYFHGITVFPAATNSYSCIVSSPKDFNDFNDLLAASQEMVSKLRSIL